MHRIDTSTAQRDKFGQGKNGFTRGNPQTGTPATQLDYLYCDAIQEEIANAIESAGIKLDKSKHDQLATAIKEFVKKGSVKFNSSTNSTSETEAATPKAVKSAYDLASNALKKGDYGIGSSVGAIANNFDEHLAGGFYQCRTTDFSDLQLSGNSTATLLAYPSNSATWKVEQLSVVNSKEPRIYYRCDTKEGKQKWHEAITTANIKDFAYEFKGDLVNKSLNELTGAETGIYFQGRNVQATSENNYPINEAGTLQVLKNGADGAGCCQIYTAYRSARQFIRNYRGGTKTWESWVEQITTANVAGFLPIGIPQPWPTTTPPDGWLKCNGWKLDKNKYPKLAQVYPSGYLPDLRGEFIRGWDDGKGTDPGRGILSWQGDAIRNIYGSTSTIQFYSQVLSNGAFGHDVLSSSGGHVGESWRGTNVALNFDASRIVPTSHDNHPRNLAFMYIVKAE